jgi:hypothetical protein
VHRAFLLALVLLALGVAPGASHAQTDVRDAVTEDWRLESPAVLVTQEELQLIAQGIQLCSDEIERLIHHRPRNVDRFTMRWVIDGGRVSHASPTGVLSHVPDDSYRLVGPGVRGWWESLVAQRLCFGPHELTHVLTWESWSLSWPNEGFAQFTDWLFAGSWRYGAEPVSPSHECDENGYSDGFGRFPYADLRSFAVTHESYDTAACFWREVHRAGGFPALRRILMRLRSHPATTVGELILHHVNPVLGFDFRPIARRYGFTDADLVATGAPPPDPPPPALELTRPRPTPAAPRSGRRLATAVAVARSDTGDPVAAATVACRARLGGRPLAGAARPFTDGLATCVWRLPATARGKILRASTAVVVLGVRGQATFTARIRR